MKMIEVKNITKKFKDATVLDDVSISFNKGEIHGIIGRNGSGKTMLFKVICGFIPVNHGKIFIDGKEIKKDTDIPNNIGIIIETPGFIPNASGFKNLQFLAKIRNTIDDSKIKETMELVNLDPRNKKWVSKYSLGMKQRLGLAQAIMENPDILILDEPMNGLDNDGVSEMREVFLKLKAQGKTILLASHNREDIMILCDTVCEMDKGKITSMEILETNSKIEFK